MGSDAAPAVTVLIAGFIHEATGIDPDSISDVVVAYSTVDDQVGVLSYVRSPSDALILFLAAAQVIAEDGPPDHSIPCR